MPETKTLFHRNDPETSYEAADRMVKSGALSRQEQKVYAKIVLYLDRIRFPRNKGITAKELAHLSGLNYYTIQRRISGLRDRGKIERIQIGQERIGATDLFKPIYKKRDGCCVWRLT